MLIVVVDCCCFVVVVQRLWFKTSVKLGNLLYEIGDFSRLSKVSNGETAV